MSKEFKVDEQIDPRPKFARLSRIFYAAAEAAGLPEGKRHPHCLKHSLGFNLVAAGVDLASIRIALGHKNISSTAIYAIPTDEQVGTVVARALASL
jgi:site-specific recombinase XerD